MCALWLASFFPVHRDPAKTSDCVCQVDGVGGFHVLHAEDPLLDPGLRLDQVAAVNAGKKPTLDRRREPAASFSTKILLTAPSVTSPR